MPDQTQRIVAHSIAEHKGYLLASGVYRVSRRRRDGTLRVWVYRTPGGEHLVAELRAGVLQLQPVGAAVAELLCELMQP